MVNEAEGGLNRGCGESTEILVHQTRAYIDS